MIYKKNTYAAGKLKASAANGEGVSKEFLKKYYQNNIKNPLDESDFKDLEDYYDFSETEVKPTTIDDLVEMAASDRNIRAYLSDYHEIKQPITTEFCDASAFDCYHIAKNNYILFDHYEEYACALSYEGYKVLDLDFFVNCADQGMENTDDNPLYFHNDHPLDHLDLTILAEFIEYGLAKIIATQGNGYRPEEFPDMKMEKGIVICNDKTYLITTDRYRTSFSITGPDIDKVIVTDADVSGQDIRHILGNGDGLLTLFEKSGHEQLIQIAKTVRDNMK